MDVHVWTSSSNPPWKYGGLRGCSATFAGDARSSAAFLLAGLAVVCWLALGQRSLIDGDAHNVSSWVLGPV